MHSSASPRTADDQPTQHNTRGASPHKEAATSGRSSSAASVGTLLRALQQENDMLRSQLLQSQQSTSVLSRQLEDALAALKEASDAQKQGPLRDTVSALQTRCQTLAERLLSVVKGRQSSQSAEVLFLLRSQQEERLFLTEALEDMLAELRGCTREAVRAQTLDAATWAQVDALHRAVRLTDEGGEAGEAAMVGLHAGTVYRLMMLAADEMLHQRAQRKLDSTRAQMALEHVQDVLADVKEATERATRSIYQCWQAAVSVGEVDCDTTANTARSSWGGASQLPGGNAGLPPRPSSNLSAGASSLHTPLPYRHDRPSGTATRSGASRGLPPSRRAQRGHASHHDRSEAYRDEDDRSEDTDEDADPFNPSLLLSAAAGPGALFPALEEELAWASDVLKACYRGLGDAQQCTAAACDALESVTPEASTSAPSAPRRYHHAGTTPAASIPGASEEVERLLDSFVADLQALSSKAALQQEGLARRLSMEMQQHYLAARQHEERVQALEAENAKLTAGWNRLQTELETRAATGRGAETPVSIQPLPPSPLPVTPERGPTVAVPLTGRRSPTGTAPFPAHTRQAGPVMYADESQHRYARAAEAKTTGKPHARVPSGADSTHRALRYDDAGGGDRAPGGRTRKRRTPSPPWASRRAEQPRRAHQEPPSQTIAVHHHPQDASLSSLDRRPTDSDGDESASDETADLWVEPSPKASRAHPEATAPLPARHSKATAVAGAARPSRRTHHFLNEHEPRAASQDATSPYHSERTPPPPPPQPQPQPARTAVHRTVTGARPTYRHAVTPPSSPAPPARSRWTSSPSAVGVRRAERATGHTPIEPVITEFLHVPPRSAAVDKLWRSLQGPSRSRPTSPWGLSPATTPGSSPSRGRRRVSPSGLVSPRRERVTSPRKDGEDMAPGTPRSWRAVRDSLVNSPTRD